MEYCNGQPCSTARLLAKADASITQDMAKMSEAGLGLIDSVADLASEFSSFDRAQEIVSERNKMNQESYEVASEAREAIRKRLAYCATCTGMVDGVCPIFDYSE